MWLANICSLNDSPIPHEVANCCEVIHNKWKLTMKSFENKFMDLMLRFLQQIFQTQRYLPTFAGLNWAISEGVHCNQAAYTSSGEVPTKICYVQNF